MFITGAPVACDSEVCRASDTSDGDDGESSQRWVFRLDTVGVGGESDSQGLVVIVDGGAGFEVGCGSGLGELEKPYAGFIFVSAWVAERRPWKR